MTSFGLCCQLVGRLQRRNMGDGWPRRFEHASMRGHSALTTCAVPDREYYPADRPIGAFKSGLQVIVISLVERGMKIYSTYVVHSYLD